MTGFTHETVLLQEVVQLLQPRPGMLILDGTLGGGGHAEALLDAGARVVGLDQDPVALDAAKRRLAGRDVVIAHGNFRDVRAVLDGLGIGEVDGALVDLGVSSPQLDDPSRGFSFREGGPLDMRMDPTRGRPLSERLAEWDDKALARILDTLGEEHFARPIARAIAQAFGAGRLTDTRQLAEVVSGAIPRKAWPKNIHPATRTFQALRIAVNDELGSLEAALPAAVELLRPGGRLAVISFHSLEDRIVKRFFQAEERGCVCPPELPACVCGRAPRLRILTRHPIAAAESEIAANPRSRSAKLRAAERLGDTKVTETDD